MTPRERLIENIINLVHARTGHAYDEALGDLLEATLKTHYAIGRWVSVEERLPQDCQKWSGHITDSKGCVKTWHGWVNDMLWPIEGSVTITHWLELDMPSGKGEA